ncbi:hypothetical protein Tco_0071189 [Tanacetum coccineum]
MKDLDSDNESVDIALGSPFPHSDNDLDDSEVLNELIENFSSKTKILFSQNVETASRFTRDAITTTSVTASGNSQVIFDEKKLGNS